VSTTNAGVSLSCAVVLLLAAGAEGAHRSPGGVHRQTAIACARSHNARMLAASMPRKPAPMLAMWAAGARGRVGPYAFGNAVGSSLTHDANSPGFAEQNYSAIGVEPLTPSPLSVDMPGPVPEADAGLPPLDNTPLQRTADGGVILPNGRIVHPTVTATQLHIGPGYEGRSGAWISDGIGGVVPQGAIIATDYEVSSLPYLFESKWGASHYSFDGSGQAYFNVPIDDQGHTRDYSPPTGFMMPTRAQLQNNAAWEGVQKGIFEELPKAIVEISNVAIDISNAQNGTAFVEGPRSALFGSIQNGTFSFNDLLGGMVQNTFGILTDLAEGSSRSMHSAGSKIAVNGALAVAPGAVAGVLRIARSGAAVVADMSAVGNVDMAGAGVDALSAQRAQLSDVVRARAEAISTQGAPGYLSRSQRGPVLTGVMDSQTGEVFWGMNQDAVPSNLNPLLQNRLDGYLATTAGDTPLRAGIPGAHSEIGALNDALNARQATTGMPVTEADLPSFLLSNRSLIGQTRVVGIPPRCLNCFSLTNGVTVVGGF
jgi:hypothetical protein